MLVNLVWASVAVLLPDWVLWLWLVLALPLLPSCCSRYVSRTMVELAFVCLQPQQVSGIPLSENKYDKRYGDRKDYQEWKKVSVVCL